MTISAANGHSAAIPRRISVFDHVRFIFLTEKASIKEIEVMPKTSWKWNILSRFKI